jgi:peptidoglycan hydrolase-like protein with peptidoglycan-binding domain
MSRRERLPDLDEGASGPLREALGAVGGALARNPVLVGGTTAFVVAFSYVAANAIWYQPHFHTGAFFATRDNGYVGPPDPTRQETTIKIERQQEVVQAPKPKPDPVVEKVQAILQSMNLYEGAVDGVDGPNTRKAVEAYRKTIGMTRGGIDEDLLEALGAKEMTAGIEPDTAMVPEPELDPERLAPPAPEPKPELISAKPGEPATTEPDPMIMKIQAGLKAFGNDKMEIDGKIGSKTRAAIREFQSLFGLPVTGEPSEEVYAKMREVGLTN